MKTHTIKTPKTELLIVELPRKADVEIFPNSIEIYNQFTGQEESIKGSYTLLGKPDDVKEEGVMELVEAPVPYWEDNKNQKVIGNAEWSYTKSLLSLLESEIYWENPFKKPDNYYNSKYGDFAQYGVGLTTDRLKWYEAQSRTFDRRKTLIFVKN